MSATIDATAHALTEMSPDGLNEWFDKRFAESMAELEAGKTPRISIMVTKGTLDWAYPPFIIGSTAAAMGWDATLFFTFYACLAKERVETAH